jgi:hypothetical protein
VTCAFAGPDLIRDPAITGLDPPSPRRVKPAGFERFEQKEMSVEPELRSADIAPFTGGEKKSGLLLRDHRLKNRRNKLSRSRNRHVNQRLGLEYGRSDKKRPLLRKPAESLDQPRFVIKMNFAVRASRRALRENRQGHRDSAAFSQLLMSARERAKIDVAENIRVQKKKTLAPEKRQRPSQAPRTSEQKLALVADKQIRAPQVQVAQAALRPFGMMMNIGNHALHARKRERVHRELRDRHTEKREQRFGLALRIGPEPRSEPRRHEHR